ncbi:MAG: ATP-binding protein, partial [Candidatus Margulisiibacteriota bacterium]
GICPLIFHTSKLGSIGPLFSIFISAFTAYAIVTQRLMGIEVIIKKGTLYSILAAIVSGIYAFSVFSVRQFFDNYGHLLPTIITALVIAVGFKRLHDFLDDITDKIFYRKKYDYKKVLRDLATRLCNILYIDELANIVTTTIREEMKLERASLIIIDREQHNIFGYETLSDNPGIVSTRVKDFSNSLILEFLSRTPEGKLFIYEELDSVKIDSFLRENIANEMAEEKIRVLIPIDHEDNKLYALALGKKLSEEDYTNDDLNVLTTMAKQISMALKTVKLHGEVLAAEKEVARTDKLACIGSLTSQIAHEIKNPIFAIKTFFETAANEEHNYDHARKEFFEFTRTEIDRINNLAHDLGQFAKKPAALIETDINVLISEQLTVLSFPIQKQAISLSADLKQIPKLNLDPNLFKQVLSNLLNNAIQAMPFSENNILSVKTWHDEKLKKVFIEIIDTGKGITNEHLPHIFEPFYTTKVSGSGLGLALTADIITTFKGTINAQNNTDGKGCTFTISLPVK